MDLRSLQQCRLFTEHTSDTIKELLAPYEARVRSLNKGEFLANEDDPAHWLIVVLQGSLEIQKVRRSGDSLTLARFRPGQLVGEAALFTHREVYPATIFAPEPARALLLPKLDLLHLLSSDIHSLSQFATALSERITVLHEKITILSFNSIRQRIAHFLLLAAQRKKSDLITLPFSKKIWAEHLNVPRPSLSRELHNLARHGYLAINGRQIRIVDVNRLEELLC